MNRPSHTYQIYFGGRCGAGIEIDDSEFRAFVRATIVPRLEAFTVETGYGYWNGKQEPVRIVTVTGLDNQGELGSTCYQIAKMYAMEYSQDAVWINCFTSHSTLVTKEHV